jgi:hypothetical protein
MYRSLFLFKIRRGCQQYYDQVLLLCQSNIISRSLNVPTFVLHSDASASTYLDRIISFCVSIFVIIYFLFIILTFFFLNTDKNQKKKCQNNKKEIYNDKYRHTRDRLFGLVHTTIVFVHLN